MIKTIRSYFLDRPDVKVGDTLSYNDCICTKVWFSWTQNLWFLECNGMYDITWGLEIINRRVKQKAMKK